VYFRTRSACRSDRSVCRRAGSRDSKVARARCRALLTEAVEVLSNVAVSRADQVSTSRSSSTARCRGGRY
jgi:hypothetical protein